MLLRRYSEVNLVVAMFLIAAVSIAPTGFFSSAAPLMLLAAGVGMCHGITMPILMSMAFTASPPGRQGEVAGARSVLNYCTMGGTQVAGGRLQQPGRHRPGDVDGGGRDLRRGLVHEAQRAAGMTGRARCGVRASSRP